MWKKVKKMFKTKRGAFSLGDLPTIVMTLVLAAGFFVGGFLALSGLDDSLTANSQAANASADVQTGLANVTSQMPVIGTIIGVAILLGILAVGFSFGRQKGFI